MQTTPLRVVVALVALLGATIILVIYFLVKKFGESKIWELVLRSVKSESEAFLINKAILYSIYALLALAFLAVLGVPIQNLLVAGGILTLAISFAAQTVISNAISGLFLMVERPLKIGDFVELKNSGISGRVKSISLFSTLLLTPNGEMARIPNATFFNDIIINKTSTVARRLEVKVGVSYDDALRALEVFKEYFTNHPDILQVPEPEIFIEDFGEYYVTIRMNLWVPTKKWYEMYKRVREDILKVCKENKIEIPYPIYVVDLKDHKRRST